MRLSKHAWQILALALFLIAFTWCSCGLVFEATEKITSAGELPDPNSGTFWITRGCCLSPAFAFAFLAYAAFHTSRRREQNIHWSEALAALGVALGMLLALTGLAIVIDPASPDPANVRAGFTAMCILPGLLVMSLSGLFWYWRRGRDDATNPPP